MTGVGHFLINSAAETNENNHKFHQQTDKSVFIAENIIAVKKLMPYKIHTQTNCIYEAGAQIYNKNTQN